MKTERITHIAVITAVGCVLGFVETLLPPVVSLRGFKLGLANIAVMFALCKYDKSSAFFVMLIKSIITSLWFSGLDSLIYSLFGGIIALGAMLTGKKVGMSAVGISMCGGVFHNIGQLLAACVVLGSISPVYLSPYLLPLGLITGLAVGVAVSLLLKYTEKISKQ